MICGIKVNWENERGSLLLSENFEASGLFKMTSYIFPFSACGILETHIYVRN